MKEGPRQYPIYVFFLLIRYYYISKIQMILNSLG